MVLIIVGNCFGRGLTLTEWIMPIYKERRLSIPIIASVAITVMFIGLLYLHFNSPSEDQTQTTTTWASPPEQFESELTVPKSSDSAIPNQEDLGPKGVWWLT